MNYIKIFTLLFYIPSMLFCQPGKIFEERFINSLINGNNADSYIQPEELEVSQRLGIKYTGVLQKYFIAYDLDDKIKDGIKKSSLEYKTSIDSLPGNCKKLTVSIPDAGYKQIFYFIDTLLVSPAKYYSSSWQVKESEYFKCFISDSLLFNEYSINRLDEFVRQTASVLGYSKDELKLLGDKKIYYYLCKDESEIEQLTGYKAKGNYILSCDYIITTYNCHYHEIVHLLMNNKIKNLPLFTHPFMQEGIAVALGGRGGYEPGVMLQLGRFISSAGYADYKEYLGYNNFKSNDPSFTYPLSGLYNLFLLNTYADPAMYIKLYTKYSGSINELNNTEISNADLAEEEKWKQFLADYNNRNILPGANEIESKVVLQNESLKVSCDNDNYFFKSKGNILITAKEKCNNYTSKLFNDELPGINYKGEKYLIKVSVSEVSLYNLFTNNIIANYAMGFSADMKPVPEENGYYLFTIPCALFEETPEELKFSLCAGQ